jgi:hypothetical protein
MDDPIILQFRRAFRLPPMTRANRRPGPSPGRPTVAFSADPPADPPIPAADRPAAVLDAPKPARRKSARKRPVPSRKPEFPIELAELERQLADDLAELDDLDEPCYAANLAVSAAGSKPDADRARAHLNRLGQRVLVLESRIARTLAEIERCW